MSGAQDAPAAWVHNTNFSDKWQAYQGRNPEGGLTKSAYGQAIDEAVNPGLYDRVKLRNGVKAEIIANQPRSAKTGRMVDPNTGKELQGNYDFGHKPKFQHAHEVERAREMGLTRKEFIARQQNASHYHLENPRSNQGHAFERPRC